MSELMNTQNSRNDFRWQLLATVSAAALLASVCVGPQAKAADGQPPFWIELGGQFAQHENAQESFLPPFVLATPRPPFAVVPPSHIEKAPPSSGDGTAKITFAPDETGWGFSAGILYGRSNRNQSVNQLTPHVSVPTSFTRYGHAHGPGTLYNAYQHITARNNENHTILDFRAGKDFGLGMFGSGGSSAVSLGVRYAQFNSQSSSVITSHPTNKNTYYLVHRINASFDAERKFTGIGPSLSWDASAGLIGNPSEGSITFDWSLNGAVLFGRQRVQAHHQTTNILYRRYTELPPFQSLVYHNNALRGRSKQVTVPNLGGFAGVSWRYPNAKVTLGYRADFYFGAMDGGIDTAHKENVGFYGPFATVSMGIGG